MSNTRLPSTLMEAMRYFADEDTCFEYVKAMRWPDGKVICPFCGHDEHSYLSTRKMWQCKGCGKQFSIRKGTIFEDSPIKLDKWLIAMWLIANAKNGISSYELARSLGVTQKTAWFMLHRIRLAMQIEADGKLGGEVEADETYIGGKRGNMHESRRAEIPLGGTGGKTAVAGILKRDGEVRTQVVRDTRKQTLCPFVEDNVSTGARIYTDALKSYEALGERFRHGVVDHAVEYVNGQVHTNGLESFWSLVKRTISGTYVSVEPFHLFRYMAEYCYRFNHRKIADSERFALLTSLISGRRLTYANLTAKVVAA